MRITLYPNKWSINFSLINKYDIITITLYYQQRYFIWMTCAWIFIKCYTSWLKAFRMPAMRNGAGSSDLKVYPRLNTNIHVYKVSEMRGIFHMENLFAIFQRSTIFLLLFQIRTSSLFNKKGFILKEQNWFHRY